MNKKLEEYKEWCYNQTWYSADEVYDILLTLESEVKTEVEKLKVAYVNEDLELRKVAGEIRRLQGAYCPDDDKLIALRRLYQRYERRLDRLSDQIIKLEQEGK